MKLILICMVAMSGLYAQIIIPADDYNYPEVEPLKAAVSTAFIGTPNGTWTDYKIPTLGRRVRGFRRNSRLPFRYLKPSAQTDRNELVYILSGFGGNSRSPKSNFLARKLADNGYHAIVLPSIFSNEFVVSSSREGVVGEFKRDAWDFFLAMKAAIEAVENQRKRAFGRKHLLGYSYGALTAAFVAKIDKTQKYLNLDKEILINPPSDLLAATKTIDHFIGEKDKMGWWNFNALLARVGSVSLYYRRYIPDTRLFLSYLEDIPLSQMQSKALVGATLGSELPDVSWAVMNTLVHDHGNTKGVEWQPSYMNFNFHDYLEKILLPYSRENHYSNDTLERINRRNAIYNLEDYFRSHPDIYLIHNKDDFLVQEGDIEFYSKAFGDRFILYPRGGHMGNLWHPQNVKAIITLIKGHPIWY